jgi:hypothetical protein
MTQFELLDTGFPERSGEVETGEVVCAEPAAANQFDVLRALRSRLAHLR